MTVKCKCKKDIEQKYDKKQNLYFYYCEKCKIGGKGEKADQAKREFVKAVQKANEPTASAGNGNTEQAITTAITIPKSKADLTKWANENINSLIASSAQFIDKPATKRMIDKNIKYAMTAELKDVWNTPEGIQSVVDSLMDAFEIGAVLPEMGCLVPYGKTAEFIPDVSAYEHALTTGKNPPFKDISIIPVFSNDIVEISQHDGNFSYEVKKIGFPRGECVGIIVQAFSIETGKYIGDAYDTERLMQKAERHSISYKYYLKDIAELRKAQSEKKDYIIKWDKKVYERDIINPYVGPDRPEMLRKLAGKSFFGKYMKVRNARAVSDEWTDSEKKNPIEMSSDELNDKILDHAMSQFDIQGDVQDAEYSEVEKSSLFDEEV